MDRVIDVQLPCKSVEVDVYKRQGLTCWPFARRFPPCSASSVRCRGWWARSARCQADVYKRQPPPEDKKGHSRYRKREHAEEGCCTIFVAKHPVTKPNLKVIKRSEEKLEEKIEDLVREAIETTEVIDVEQM